jgi:rhodanese-related sulfurtransferase
MNTLTRGRRRTFAAWFAVAGSLACRVDTGDLDTLTVQELSALLIAGADIVLLDANTDETRANLGIIPAARLLSSYRDYDPESELPTERNRPLVFYCHSARCGAAVSAAERALEAGYPSVSVMPDGITGWIEAGSPVERPASQTGEPS